MKKDKKEFLFIAATHGDEEIGVATMKKIKTNKDKFDWIIGNPKAFEQENRFFERDLNRSAPGKKNAEEYELRRAYEIMKICKDYKYIIDLHGASASCGSFTLISYPKLENLFLASALPIKNVVLWPSKEWKEFGPLTQFVDCGLEIESGPKKDQKTRSKLRKIVKSILKNGVNFNLYQIKEKKWFLVYGKMKKTKARKNISKEMKEFKKIEVEKESFYPLLINQYKDLVCYKMKKMDFFDQFSY